ncbi:hypothetical protein RFI_33113, partial [Reticulomyxa filosa]
LNIPEQSLYGVWSKCFFAKKKTCKTFGVDKSFSVKRLKKKLKKKTNHLYANKIIELISPELKILYFFLVALTPFRKEFFNLKSIFSYLKWNSFKKHSAQLRKRLSLKYDSIIFDNNLSQTLFSKANFSNKYNYSITLQQQEQLMHLLKVFGYQIDKTTILKTWRNYDNIFVDTLEKLKEICVNSNVNGLKEENEFKILREMCLHILWNILKYPRHIKYHQINEQALCADFKHMFGKTENQLQYYGFKKGNDDNWYYQYDHIQISHLWNCYKYCIKEQIMYFHAFILLLLIEQMI